MPDMTSFDPRDTIRQAVGTSVWSQKEKKTTYCMVVADDQGRTYNVPMLLSEECRTNILPETPLIKMHRASATYIPHNILADVRFFEAYIDMKVYITNVRGITVSSFKQQILNALQNAIRTNQVGIAGQYWMNIESERDTEEDDGRQVVFVYIVTLYVQKHDAC